MKEEIKINFFSPAEIIQSYSASGKVRAGRSFKQLILLSVVAGVYISLGCVATNTIAHSLGDVSSMRIAMGLFFPFSLCMVLITGAELFTGNSLMGISLLNKEISFSKLLRNWVIVYIGNFVGSVSIAAACAFFGQMYYSQNGLAVFTIRVAAGKASMPFQNAFVLAILCNILVCTAILCSISAKDTAGKILGAYIPVSFFIFSGFEHCVANMYYIPAGIFALANPDYASLAIKAGLDLSSLTWTNFFFANLLPVTLGNIIGGFSIGAVLWVAYCGKKPTAP